MSREPVPGLEVAAGPADPERARRLAAVGIQDHRWLVRVGGQEVGIGTREQCLALAEELHVDPEKARAVAEWMRKSDEDIAAGRKPPVRR